jgi:hypothetical protein
MLLDTTAVPLVIVDYVQLTLTPMHDQHDRYYC